MDFNDPAMTTRLCAIMPAGPGHDLAKNKKISQPSSDEKLAVNNSLRIWTVVVFLLVQERCKEILQKYCCG